MIYKSAAIRSIALLLIVALAGSVAVAGVVSQDKKKIYEAKDLMYESNYAEAHKLFIELARKEASEVRDEALYFAARCSYNMKELERARQELLQFERIIEESRWSDDAAQLLNDVNRALGKTGDPEAVLSVSSVGREAQRAARESQSAARKAQRSAGEAGKAAREAQRSAVKATRGVRGSSSQEDEDCNDPRGKKEAALNALLHMDDEERAVDIIERFLDTDPCDRLKIKSLFILSQTETGRALDKLVSIARTDESMSVRKKALFWVGQFDDERAANVLIEMYDDVDDAATKKDIIFSLSRQDYSKSLQKLVSIAKNETNLEARKSAVFWIGQADDSPEIVDTMREIYNNASESKEIRKDVLFALSQHDSQESTDVLFEVTRTEPDTDLRKKAIFWLGQSDDPRAVDHLVSLYGKETDFEIRSQILFTLGNLDNAERALPHLRTFYEQADSVELKKKIIFALYQVADEEDQAVDLMIELLEKEKDESARKNLLFWLNQSDNPKAQEYILESIEEDLIG